MFFCVILSAEPESALRIWLAKKASNTILVNFKNMQIETSILTTRFPPPSPLCRVEFARFEETFAVFFLRLAKVGVFKHGSLGS